MHGAVHLFICLLYTSFYNMISNILRALGDSRTPLCFLVFSSMLNVILDIIFIVPFHMGVAGAAWATVLSQLISSICCLISGLKAFPVLHLRKKDFFGIKETVKVHVKLGFIMGFQMSVMCIGQMCIRDRCRTFPCIYKWRSEKKKYRSRRYFCCCSGSAFFTAVCDGKLWRNHRIYLVSICTCCSFYFRKKDASVCENRKSLQRASGRNAGNGKMCIRDRQ